MQNHYMNKGEFEEKLNQIKNNAPSISTLKIKTLEAGKLHDGGKINIDIDVTKERIVKLADALKQNTHITTLDASTAIYISPLLESLLINSSVTDLNLHGTQIGRSLTADVISIILPMQFLPLNPNNIKNNNLELICSVLDRGNIKSLNLSWTSLSDKQAASLFKELHTNNNKLEILKLDNNYIDSNGAIAMSECLKSNKTLKNISVKNNKFHDDAAHNIKDIFSYNDNIEHLYFNNNSHLTQEGINILTNLEQETNIVHITGDSNCVIS